MVEVVGDVVGGKAAVTHYKVIRFHLCDSGNDILIDFIVKTSNQIAILYDKYAFAVDFLRLNITR